jgi:PAS domain S-box-containing protein
VVVSGEPFQFETYFPPMDKYFVISATSMGGDLFATIFFDVTGQKKSEEALKRAIQSAATAEHHYRLMFNSGSDALFVYKVGADGLPGQFLEVNDNACRCLGYTREELLRMRVSDISAPESDSGAQALTERILAEDRLVWEKTFVARDGRRIPVEIGAHVFDLDGSPAIISSVRDISERKEAELARAGLEEQLRQSQKLESVGRLAGGVAHDFNNLLTVINGYCALLIEELNAPEKQRSYAEAIRKAGERATSLTKQLLAFSRKQVIAPRVLDLNAAIRESAPMLQRLIGEDIELHTRLEESLGMVMADPDQIHQVLMNLAVNARDAMPDGGKLDIVTANADAGEEGGAATHPDALPGRYVLMSVSDTGSGMDAAIRQHIFEPFFTTKEAGKGTGLGLSTVYGIVRQSGGWIDVRSAVGAGSSFQIYLPRLDGCPAPERIAIGAPADGGNETILVVEDQTAVRSFTKAVLKRYGYRVIEASSGEEATAAAERHAGQIHLLLTDVVLPGVNGKDLSEQLSAVRGDMKVLFMSGYTADVIAHHGVLNRGVAFLQKPFTPDELAEKVRSVLTGPLGQIEGSQGPVAE